MNKPKEIIISITNRCNFRCRMCQIPHNISEELSTSQWKQVIKDAASCGARSIVFSGGEPLLREDIFELISFVKSNSLGACLSSNGYFIDNGVAGRLRQAGIEVVNVSIEGPQRIHDYMRGKGMFKKAIRALENLKKCKIETTIATTVSRYNFKYLACIEKIASQYGVTTIKFQPFSKIFLANRQGGENFLISDKEIGAAGQVIDRVIESCRNHAIATNPAGYLKMIPFYLGGKHRRLNNGCAALENSCPINCNGDIYPCWVLTDKDKLLGNLRENSLLNIWGSSGHREIIEKIKSGNCPGCMMSCYDDNFGKESIERRIAMNVRRLQRKGAREYARGILKKLVKRIKFYSSYRGSLKGIINRMRGSVRNKKTVNVKLGQEEIALALKEIELAKHILEKELKGSKWK